jgi:hypothetical protein
VKIYIKPHRLKFHFRRDNLVIDKSELENQWNALFEIRNGIIDIYTKQTNPRKGEVLWDIIVRQSHELMKLRKMINELD